MKGYVCTGLTTNMFGEAITDVIWSCENIVSNRRLWPKLPTLGYTCNFSLAIGIFTLLKSCKLPKCTAHFTEKHFIVPSAAEIQELPTVWTLEVSRVQICVGKHTWIALHLN